jgi:hypothetical protein
MNVKNQQLLWDLYAGIARDVKNQRLLWKLYAGIARNVKKIPANTMGPICGYCKECKMLAAIMGLICRYCNECKMPTAILGLIYRYYIFENLLMEFIIENDVGIICLK